MAGEAADETGERTEAATPRRRQRAREAGQVAVSREVASALSLMVTAVVVGGAAPALAGSVLRRLTPLLGGAALLEPAQALGVAVRCAAWTVLPVAALAALASGAAVFGQTGLLLRLAALQPSLARLNPGGGLRRVFGAASLAEAGRGVLRFAFVCGGAWLVLRDARALCLMSLDGTSLVLLDHLRHVAERLILVVLGAQAVMAVLDVLRARLALGRDLRMSRQELREEHRESEGDPQIKARIRRLRVLRAKRRMMAAVPRAVVVVTNPTHYAVALAYERGSAGAPRVVAKGIDAMAARIREVARDARVPLIANPPLARALWRIELDAEVPADLFAAVAEVIAAVWRLRVPRGQRR